MKKIMTAALAATVAITAMTSCCGKGQCSDNSCDTTVSKATVDSISLAQGNYIGFAVLSNFPQIEAQTKATKEDLIKGIQLALNNDNNEGVKIGIQFGLQMLNEMKQLQEMGVKVDKSAMLNQFKRAFLQDTIDESAAQQSYLAYQTLVNRVQREQREREEARIAASPEALKNVADGADYVAKAKSADPEIKTADSGLSYKIENEGTGTKAADGKRMRIAYKESKIDGTVIADTGEEGRIMYLANMNPGFAEGLKMVGKGGKATFYVPGEIAYGVNGVPTRNVGPNETIVYEVSIIDVEE